MAFRAAWQVEACVTGPYNPWRAQGEGRHVQGAPQDPSALWELYDMHADRTEQHDLAAQDPKRVKEMTALYANWETRLTIGTGRRDPE